jgi:hypothetical protein
MISKNQGLGVEVFGRNTCNFWNIQQAMQAGKAYEAARKSAVISAVQRALSSYGIQASVNASVVWGDIPQWGPNWLILIYPSQDYAVDENAVAKSIYEAVVTTEAGQIISGCAISWQPYSEYTRPFVVPISPFFKYTVEAAKWAGVIAGGLLAWYLFGPAAGAVVSLAGTFLLRPSPLSNYLPSLPQLGTYLGIALLVGGALYLGFILLSRRQVVVIKEG